MKTTAFLSSVLALTVASSAFAESVTYNKSARVISVNPSYETVEEQTPKRVCKTTEVPVYETTRKDGDDSIISFIIGGAIGSAVGKQISDANGAGTVGAIVGGALANEHQKKHNSTQDVKIVGYKRAEQCETHYTSKRVQRLVDNRVLAEYNGMRFEYNTTDGVEVGDRVAVRVTLEKH